MKKMLSVFLSFAMVFSLSCPVFAVEEIEKDLLFVTIDDAAISSQAVPDYINYDMVPMSELYQYNLNRYHAIAIPYTLGTGLSDYLTEQYNLGTQIYLYGEITINEYSNVLNISNFGIDVPVETVDSLSDTSLSKDMFLTFSDNYSSSVKHNVIMLDKNAQTGLLAKIPQSSIVSNDVSLFLKVIVDDLESQSSISPNSTIVDHGFNFKSYDYIGNSVTLDWTLYQEEADELDWKYYAIKTNIVAETDYFNAERLEVKYSLPYMGDEYLDSSPSDSEEEVSFTVGLSFGEAISSMLSWVFTFTNAPSIDRSVSLSDDSVEWEVRNDFFGLNGEQFQPGMSWRTSKSVAGVDISFRGLFANYQSGEGQWSEWADVEVRYY